MEQKQTAKLFINWTDDDFAYTGKDGEVKDENCRWDGVPYSFPAGSSMYLESWKADHFAKHLVDRELNRLDKPTNHPLRKQLLAKCFGAETIEAPDVSKLQSEVLNKNVAEGKEPIPEPEARTRIAEKPKTSTKPKATKAKAEPAKADEGEFEGLNPGTDAQ
jgi:hypothetical protein